MIVLASHRALAMVSCSVAVLCATEVCAQRYAPDGSVIPDAVLRPDQTPGDPALSPDAVRADPVLSPDAVTPDPVRPAD